MKKVKIDYPCRWVYKVIGLDQDRMRAAITELIPDGDCVITTSRSSVTGRYHCLNIDKPVKNEDDRVSLYEACVTPGDQNRSMKKKKSRKETD